MNWKVLFYLSLLGIPAGIVQLYNLWGNPIVELFVMLLIAIGCAVVTLRCTRHKLYLHGFLLTIMFGFWQNVLYLSCYGLEQTNHAEYLASLGDWGIEEHFALLLSGVGTDVVQGLFLGLIFFVGGKIAPPEERMAE